MTGISSSLSLGNLDATELGIVTCLCLLLGALALGWRARRALENEVSRLEGELADLDRRQRELDPSDRRTRDEGLVELLRSLLDYTRAAGSYGERETNGGAEQNEEML